jgi:YjbE family integral membrane protein
MELFSPGFISALSAIVLIDLVLAGDNALVIGLVARNLPKSQQRQVILWGALGAIVVRALMTIGVVWLLKIPGFLLVGGLALIWIARKLLVAPPEEEVASETVAVKSLFDAVRTIVIADTVMGVDNVLAIGGVARDDVLLIVLGLAISVPIIVWGSRLVILLVELYPAVILLGSGVLAWTAFKMIGQEAVVRGITEKHPPIVLAIGIATAAISLGPWLRDKLGGYHRPLAVVLPGMLVWLIALGVVMDAAGVPRIVTGEPSLAEGAFHFLRWAGWMPLAAGYFWLSDRRRAGGFRAERVNPARRKASWSP